MIERVYRLVLGFAMMVCLFMDWRYAIYAMLGLMIFEGLTNWRIPTLLSRMRFSDSEFDLSEDERPCGHINFEAERMLRWVMASIVLLGYVVFPEALWFLPWFVSLNLMLAGITGICPMILLLRRLGFR